MDPYARLPRKLPFTTASLPKKVIATYIFDYLIILILIAAFYIIDRIEPHHQQFALANYTLQYPYAEHETIPIPLALVLVVVVPAGVIVFYTLIVDGLFSHHKAAGSRRGPYTLRKRLWELNCGILGLLLASGSALVITQALKNATGKPRPDFLDRCRPTEGSTDSSTNAVNGYPNGTQFWGLSTDEICTRRELLRDGFRSWPSGHSSSAFAGLFYLTLYLAGKLHVLDSRGFVWKTFAVLIPTLGAGLIAVTRIQDNRHHPFDVLTGSTLGILCAWASYRQYFPPLSEPWRKGRAYPIRTWGSPADPQYVGDGGWRSGGGGIARGGPGMESLRAGAAPPGLGGQGMSTGASTGAMGGGGSVSRMNTVPLHDGSGPSSSDREAAMAAPPLIRRRTAEERVQADRRDYEDYYGAAADRDRDRENWEETSSEDDEDDRLDARRRRARGVDGGAGSGSLEAFELRPTHGQGLGSGQVTPGSEGLGPQRMPGTAL